MCSAARFAAAVLAGGRSSRFGSDKSLALVDGRSMIVHVVSTLVDAGAGSVFVVGGNSAGLGALGLRCVADRFPGDGPLGAIVTAMDVVSATVADELLVVLACDLPSIDAATVRALVGEATSPARPDVAVARGGDGPDPRLEPLVACWRVAACRPALAERFARGERAVHRAIDGLRVAAATVPTARLRNINRVSDLPLGDDRP